MLPTTTSDAYQILLGMYDPDGHVMTDQIPHTLVLCLAHAVMVENAELRTRLDDLEARLPRTDA